MEKTEASSTNESLSLNDNLDNDSSVQSSVIKLPQKRFFRQRAHANPFSDHLLE
jgi:hypothetical protein